MSDDMFDGTGIPMGLMLPIITAYNQPDRFYHNLQHVQEMLGFIDANAGDGALRTSRVRYAKLGAVYHDVVNDPTATKGVNEARSIAWAVGDIYSILCNGDACKVSQIVTEMIIGTIDHAPSDNDGVQLVIEADLARFASPNFQHWDHCVRLEYSHVQEDDWLEGRLAVLEHYWEICKSFRMGEEAGERSANACANIRELIKAIET